MSRLVVVGDALLDRDLDGRVERLCPDAPVPVVDDPSSTARPGGAALAAALAAADGVQGEQVYQHGLGEHALIDPRVAEAYVADYLAAVRAAARYPGLRYSVEARGDSVVVRVSAPLDLPFTPPGWERRPVVTGTAASYVVVTE